MKPKWQKLASLAQKICTLWFQFFGAIFASEGYPFKNIFAMKPYNFVIFQRWGSGPPAPLWICPWIKARRIVQCHYITNLNTWCGQLVTSSHGRHLSKLCP